jgi:hypothetical protein
MTWGGRLCACLLAGLLGQSLCAGQPRLAVPEEPVAHQARRALDELYAARLVARDPGSYTVVARELIAKAQRQAEDATYLFVLLEKARSLALQAGEAQLSLRATRMAAEAFNLDSLALYRDTLQQLSLREIAPATVVHQAIRQALAAADQERYDFAVAFSEIAVRVARRSRDPQLIQQAEASSYDARRGRELVASFSHNSTTQPASHPQARYLLFYRRDREAGLAMMAGSNDSLAPLAQREQAISNDAEATVSLAADWWNAAGRSLDVPAWRVRRHACELYARALPQLTGIRRDVVEKRIGDARIDQLLSQGYASGALVEVLKADDPAYSARSIAADIILPADDLPKSGYSVRCSGLIDVPVEGSYEFLLVAGTGARLAIAGKTLVDDPAFYRKRSGETVSVTLAQGLHEIVTEITVGGGRPKLQLTWRRPGQKDFTPIPTTALYHEDE